MLSLEIEGNQNCDEMPLMVFPTVGESKPISKVRILRPGDHPRPYHVTGWSSTDGGTPCQAYWVQVEDSGAGFSYLVYGDDWGLRFKAIDVDEPWDVSSSHQWGEPYIILVDRDDVIDQEDDA